ncbi:hypothetical protein [Spirulina sp. 06S082]|uniref:hypothetical protein n=1 Tax=Spirulina sp. 06S082 TaxID=3110248 RepID=UPI002B1F2557|nr:hypothetical protein [Spirulina sp. 06S082]MEA5469669.1 hypothetical protein [Spirulina sp. 06S082]
MFDKPQRSYKTKSRSSSSRETNTVPGTTSSQKAIQTVENTALRSGEKAGEALQNFARSIGEVLIDITALEVNTMVVDRITGAKFIPWQTYYSVYDINEADLRRRDIPIGECDRYLSLRKKLAVEYALIASDPSSPLYDERMLEILSTSPDQIILPNPHPSDYDREGKLEIQRVQKLLQNGSFIRALRKVGELKACLDNQKRHVERLKLEHPDRNFKDLHEGMNMDMIYAQTVVQLDGDMINRYAKEILDHPQRDLILQLHHESVASGEKQWRGLFEFFLGLVQQAVSQREGGFFDFLRR